jgi:hypothetical protein
VSPQPVWTWYGKEKTTCPKMNPGSLGIQTVIDKQRTTPAHDIVITIIIIIIIIIIMK